MHVNPSIPYLWSEARGKSAELHFVELEEVAYIDVHQEEDQALPAVLDILVRQEDKMIDMDVLVTNTGKTSVTIPSRMDDDELSLSCNCGSSLLLIRIS